MLKWGPQFETGIKSIDEQHEKFVKMMNQLLGSGYSADRPQEILDVIKKLNDYAGYHFSFEEKIFEDNGYSESELHKEQHRVFAERLKKYERDASQGNPPKASALFAEMKGWLIQHISQEDMKGAKDLKSKGVV